MTLEFDPRVQPPAWTISPDILAPIVALISFGPMSIAVVGLRLTRAAKVKLRYERARQCRCDERARRQTVKGRLTNV